MFFFSSRCLFVELVNLFNWNDKSHNSINENSLKNENPWQHCDLLYLILILFRNGYLSILLYIPFCLTFDVTLIKLGSVILFLVYTIILGDTIVSSSKLLINRKNWMGVAQTIPKFESWVLVSKSETMKMLLKQNSS